MPRRDQGKSCPRRLTAPENYSDNSYNRTPAGCSTLDTQPREKENNYARTLGHSTVGRLSGIMLVIVAGSGLRSFPTAFAIEVVAYLCSMIFKPFNFDSNANAVVRFFSCTDRDASLLHALAKLRRVHILLQPFTSEGPRRVQRRH